MPLDGWYSLAPKQAAPITASAKKPLDTRPAADGPEWIAVYGKRSNRDADWRGDKRAGIITYEAAQSDAAQRLYASSPIWYTPEQQRLMSDAKDALGPCGSLGGLVTCPKP